MFSSSTSRDAPGWPGGPRMPGSGSGTRNPSGCSRLAALPASMGRQRLSQLDITDCTALTGLPDGLEVVSWIELARSGVKALPRSLADARLRWNGVTIDNRIAFRPETIAVGEILSESNAGCRRVLLERYGLERFMTDANAEVRDEDCDAGGVRKLLRSPRRGRGPGLRPGASPVHRRAIPAPRPAHDDHLPPGHRLDRRVR